MIKRIMRREIRRDVLLRRIVTFLHVCLVAWCKMIKRRLVIVRITLLLLITFFIVFFVLTCCNDSSCFYFDDCSCYFIFDGRRLKCLLNIVLIIF